MVRGKVEKSQATRTGIPARAMQNILGPKAVALFLKSNGRLPLTEIARRLDVCDSRIIKKWLTYFDAFNLLKERLASPIAAAELLQRILLRRIEILGKDPEKCTPGDADALNKLTNVLRAVKGRVDIREAWTIFLTDFGEFVHARRKDDPEYLENLVSDMRAFGTKILEEEFRAAA